MPVLLTSGLWSTLCRQTLKRLIPVLFLVLLGSSELCALMAERSALAEKSLLLDIAAAEQLVIAVGERGHILRSDDAGHSWQQAEVPTRTTLTGVFLLDSNLAWAVGHDQVILRSEDGGKSWRQVFSAPEEESPLLDVWFADARRGYAIGAYGRFLETGDGGESWTSRWISEDDYHLNKMFAVGSYLFLAAEAGQVYRSADGGENWDGLLTPYEGSFFGGLGLGPDSLMVFGLRGNLFRSSDAGETWQQVATATEANLTDAVALKDGRLLVGGLAGTLLVSQDNGESFSLVQQPDRQGTAALLQVESGIFIRVGEGGLQPLSTKLLSTGE
ncbi:MAG: YCF48-related protein [Desulfuromonadales bacterium]|jgi:photosystem II stability/assembly factor-like uncharacterized protein|nr:YCF48-related protein [Desulfuromonadales bacterium]